MHVKLKEGIGLNIDASQDSKRMYYFAYGSCMGDDFCRTVPEFLRHGAATLQGYRLAFTRESSSRRGGVADIVQDASGSVEGVLYEFDEAYLEEVDWREGVDGGAYRRIPVTVEMVRGPVNAWTYEVVEKREIEIPPHEDYASLILNGAKPYVSSDYWNWLVEHICALRDYSEKYDNMRGIG